MKFMNKCLNCEKEVKNKYCSIRCQNIHQGAGRANKKYGELKLFSIECNKCKISFNIKEREKFFPQKNIYYCSRVCANSRDHSDETKKQTTLSLIKHYAGNRNIDKSKTCEGCGKEYHSRIKKSSFCSRSCKSSFAMKNGQASIMGRKSVNIQKEIRRSKNEIYFGELCQQHFKTIKLNEPMFNGWDADVIIEDLKLAVLWNGAWHYKKITRKHSIEQVQNRDKIKLKEIEFAGYKSYIIKDMGKWNKKFVEEKFEEMLAYLKL